MAEPRTWTLGTMGGEPIVRSGDSMIYGSAVRVVEAQPVVKLLEHLLVAYDLAPSVEAEAWTLLHQIRGRDQEEQG